MVNIAFQKSLRSKDKDKFVASLREGGMVEDKSYLQETLSNVVPSGKKLIKETADMIMNPVDTAKSLYQLGSGVVQLAIPGEQKNEEVARAAGQYFADRYGSLEKAKESLKNDPVGVLTEVVGVVTGGAGLGKVAATGAGKALKALPEIDTTAMASFPAMKFKDKSNSTIPTDKNLEIGTNPALVGGSKLKNYTYEDVLNIREAAKNSTAGTTQANKLINNEVAEGTKIATRLNLNSKIENSVGGVDKLQTLHDKTFNGKALSYMPDVTMTDIVFSVSQKGRQSIAAKVKGINVPEAKAKHPAMSVDGKFTTKRNVLEEMGDDVIEIGIDPINQHLFIDMNTGQAVKSADIGTVIGSRVYAKGVKYHKKSEAPKPNKASDGTEIPSNVRYAFNKGGIPMAATGIGLEEIKVTHTDGGGGRGFREFRGSGGGKEYAMNYEPSRGGVEQGGTGSQQPTEEPKEETPEIEEIVVTSVRENFNSFMNEENPVFNYNVTNFLNPESLQSISSFTQGNDNVSEIDVYSILFAESSGGQRENPAASGPLQVQLGAFIDSQRHQNIYGPVPPKDTPEYKIYMEKAEKDFNALDQTGYVETGLNYLESLNQRFERNNKRKPTIEESALLYTEGYKGGMKYIEGEKDWRESTKLKVYIPNVLKAYTALTVKDSAINFEEGGTPWGGATGTIYKEPSGPKPLQQQMINAFSTGGVIKDIALGSLIPGYGAMKAFAKVGDSLNKDSDTYSGPSMSYDTSVALDRLGRGIDTSHPEAPRYSTFSPDVYESKMMEDDEGYDEAYNYTQEMRDIQNNLSDLDIENNDKELLKNYINNVFFKSNEISYEGDTKESSDRKKLFYPTIPPRQAYPEGTGEKEQKSLIEYYVLPEDLENIIKNVKELSIASPNAKKLFDKKIIEHRYTTDRSPFHIDGPGEQTATYKTIRFSLNDIIKDIEEKGTERNKETGLYNSNGLNILAALAEFKKQEEAGNILPKDNPIRIISEKDIFI